MMVTPTQLRISLEDFMELYSDEGPFEYIAGEFIPMSPQAPGSARVAGNLFFELKQHLRAHPVGEVFIEAPFVLTADEANWVKGSRVPDLMFFTADRLATYTNQVPDWREKPFILVPDLVVEVISPTDRFSNVNRKVLRYLEDGVRLIWVIDPQQSTAAVHHHNSDQVTQISPNGNLSGETIIPGFEIALSTIIQ